MATNLRQAITQCVVVGFSSFLKRWNPLIEGYNTAAFDIYHMMRCVCVLERFKCMLFDGWTLILGIGPFW